MKKLFLIAAFVLAAFCLNSTLKGQLSLSYQYSSLDKIGLGFNFSKRFWTELRIYGNTYIESITPELALLYNVSVKENHEVYLGAGAVVNYFNGIIIPLGIQIRPFEKFRNFSFQIEFQPLIEVEIEDMLLQASAGIRYRFGRKKS